MSRRVWRPAVDGNPKTGTAPILKGMHFHDTRHTHKTWLIEDDIPEIAQARRLGHHIPGVRGIYSPTHRHQPGTPLARHHPTQTRHRTATPSRLNALPHRLVRLETTMPRPRTRQPARGLGIDGRQANPAAPERETTPALTPTT